MTPGASSTECTCPYCRALSMVSAIKENSNTHLEVKCDLCGGHYRIRNPRFAQPSEEPTVGTPAAEPDADRLAAAITGQGGSMQGEFCDIFARAANRLGTGGTQAVAVLIVGPEGQLFTEWAGERGTHHALLGAIHAMAHRYAKRLDEQGRPVE